MEKAKHPTSKYKVFCDYYDTELSAEFHLTDKGETKLKLTLGEVEDEDNSYSLSLYGEDVATIGKFLIQAAEFTDKRK